MIVIHFGATFIIQKFIMSATMPSSPQSSAGPMELFI